MSNYDKLKLISDLISLRGVPKPEYNRNYVPGLKTHPIEGLNVAGVTPNPKRIPAMDEVFYDWKNNPTGNIHHEVDHILQQRSGYKDPMLELLGPQVYTEFEVKLKDTLKRNKEALAKKYPKVFSNSAYFANPSGIPVTELMAELNAVEDTYKVDLLKDDLLKDVFFNRNVADAYKASTGYRRTRMDARDPRPYSMDKGFWQRLLDHFRN